MKIIITALLILGALNISAQKAIAPSDNFTIEGKVKEPKTFSLQDLVDLPSTSVDSIVITNHLKEKRHTIQGVKGVLLKDLLGKITIDQDNVKQLSEYYIVCIASDNYKVVYSWNEIFNTETGRHVLIMTEGDGKKGVAMTDRIAIISPTDDATGRRFVKGLKKIVIERVP